jgi:hypothetical protein
MDGRGFQVLLEISKHCLEGLLQMPINRCLGEPLQPTAAETRMR